MADVPPDIVLDWRSSNDVVRVYARSAGRDLGHATALRNPKAPDEWVVRDLHFEDDDHWYSLGHSLLELLVSTIEAVPGCDGSTVITAVTSDTRFRDALTSRIQHRPEPRSPGLSLAEELERRAPELDLSRPRLPTEPLSNE